MDTPLFRPQSLTPRGHAGLGPVSIASAPSHTMWVAGALLCALVVGSTLTFGHYTRRERSLGTLVPTTGLVRLTARDAGTVWEVLVSEGTAVVPGQALLRISGEKNSQAWGHTASAVTASLIMQEVALQAEMLGVDRLAAQQRDALRQSEVLLNGELRGFARQLDIAHQQTAGYVALLERIRPLVAKGFVSQLQVQQLEAQALDAKAQTEALLRQKADAQRQRSDTRSQLAQLPTNSDTKRSELRRQHAQLQQAMLENEAGRLSTVVATSAGTVSSLLAVVGQSLVPGEPLLAMVPTSSSLEAHLLVPSSAIGFVRIGTPVKLHYVAFPYQKFGIQNGHVTQVSRSALTASEAAATGSETPENHPSRYRIRVALDRQTIVAYGKAERLLPGMAVEADLMLDRRTLLEWLLEPLLGVRQRIKASGV